jgi:hypothetical protein
VLWLEAFLITQIVEIPIYLFALGDRPVWQRPLLAFGASTLTHPIVWIATYRLSTLFGGGGHTTTSWWLAVAITETFAVLAEAAWFRAFKVRRALLWSLGANAASFGFGLLLGALGLWP